jgi:hypothetical protein
MMPKIKAKTWSRFNITNLHIEAQLIGQKHDFIFEGKRICILLPSKEAANKRNPRSETAHPVSYWASTNEPITYAIDQIDIEIEIPELVSVPEVALSEPPTQYEAFTKEEQSFAKSITKTYSILAKEIMEHWVDILRWTSGYALIGQPSLTSVHSGWSTYISSAETGKRVWSGSQTSIVSWNPPVKLEDWDSAARRLANGDKLPIHLRFLHEAECSIEHHQIEKSIIETAMACETFLRYSVLHTISNSLQSEIIKYIEEANINKYVTQFFKSIVPNEREEAYKEISKDLSSLFSRRNSYIHMGTIPPTDRIRCMKFIQTTKLLFSILDSQNQS